jgi:hypothetical protein
MGITESDGVPNMGQFHKWSRLRACFGMRGGHSSWPKEQDGRSFVLGQTVECLACNEGAEDLCAQDCELRADDSVL